MAISEYGLGGSPDPARSRIWLPKYIEQDLALDLL